MKYIYIYIIELVLGLPTMAFSGIDSQRFVNSDGGAEGNLRTPKVVFRLS